MRDGRVGVAGQPNGRPEGPNEMFPAAAAKWGPFETAEQMSWGRRKPPRPPRGGGGGDGGRGASHGDDDPAADGAWLAAVSGDSALEREHMTERGRERIRTGR